MTDERVFSLVFGMMAGALIGWLAPALVSLAIIAVVCIGYYLPLGKWRDDRYTGTAVAVMNARW